MYRVKRRASKGGGHRQEGLRVGKHEQGRMGQGWGRGRGKEETQPGRGEREQEREIRGEGEVAEGTDSGRHHPATVDGENSCGLRESGSLEDSDEWLEEWQC